MWGRASALQTDACGRDFIPARQRTRPKEAALEGAAIGIRPHALRAVGAHAAETWPQECCGLLIGTAGSIEAVYRACNVHEECGTRYLVRPEDHFAAIRVARARALDVVGAYHSHPAGRPRPSATDRDEAHVVMRRTPAGSSISSRAHADSAARHSAGGVTPAGGGRSTIADERDGAAPREASRREGTGWPPGAWWGGTSSRCRSSDWPERM
jgi:proteasome lid subunit RPN8/RPN11